MNHSVTGKAEIKRSFLHFFLKTAHEGNSMITRGEGDQAAGRRSVKQAPGNPSVHMAEKI